MKELLVRQGQLNAAFDRDKTNASPATGRSSSRDFFRSLHVRDFAAFERNLQVFVHVDLLGAEIDFLFGLAQSCLPGPWSFPSECSGAQLAALAPPPAAPAHLAVHSADSVPRPALANHRC